MTDYTELVEKLRDLGTRSTYKAADTIEALQAENARLTARLEKAREVIRPLSDLAQWLSKPAETDARRYAPGTDQITVAEVRAARAFMEEGE